MVMGSIQVGERKVAQVLRDFKFHFLVQVPKVAQDFRNIVKLMIFNILSMPIDAK